MKFEDVKASIESRWNRCKIRDDGVAGAEKAANKIIASKDTYKKVEFATGVPWWFIGVLHSLESNFDFSAWLANGDPINAPTVQVPEGLVCDGTWHNAAIVSLVHMDYHKEKDWSLLKALYLAEAYNGWGYANRGKPSQYVWSFTNIEEAGRYVADGIWDANAWSDQIGVAAILKKLMEKFVVTFDTVSPKPADTFKISWYEMNLKAEGKAVLIGYDGDNAKFIADIETSENLEDIFKLYGKHNVEVAPANKPIPFIPGSGRGPASVASGLAKKIHDYYASSTGYAEVKADVMGWFGTTTNGCVAFASTALRRCGADIPKHVMRDGEDATLVTLPFSKYMGDVLKWKKITDANLLEPGDVVLTLENNDPGYPAHTYIFSGWVSKSTGTGYIIDNQGPRHQRNIFGYAEFNMTPFAYAFRPS